MPRRINQATIDLIKEFEGFRARAYRDAVGVWTIGYGHTSLAGPPAVRPGMRITRKEGERILRRDVERFAAGVVEALGPHAAKLNDNQFGALVSFSYNVGLGALRRSSVLKAVKAGRLDDVPGKLMLWTKAGGRRLKGLVRRRRAEGRLFVTPPNKSGPPVAVAAKTRARQEAVRPSAPTQVAIGGGAVALFTLAQLYGWLIAATTAGVIAGAFGVWLLTREPEEGASS